MNSQVRRYSFLLTTIVMVLLLLGIQTSAVFALPNNTWPGTLLGAGVFTDNGANNAFTNQAGETNGAGCPNGVRSGWWRFTAPVTATYIINTNGSSTFPDTILSVWDRPGSYPTDATGRLACDDDSGTGNQSLVTVNLTAGTTYQIRVSSNNNFNGNYFLNITQAPTITPIANQTINEDTSTGALTFTVGDAETPAAALTVTRASSDTGLFPTANIVLGGAGANRTVTVTPAANQTGTATITLTVTDANGGTATTSFTVTVNPLPDAPDIRVGLIPGVTRTINEDAAGTLFNCYFDDPDVVDDAGLTLSYVASNPTLGTVTITTGVLLGQPYCVVTFVPAANQNGVTVITVTVTDDTGLTDSMNFTVTVNQVNDGPTNLTLSNNNVAENATNGTVIGTFTTTDVDIATNGQTHTYTLVTSSVPGIFSIVGNELRVANAALLDFETTPTVNISVRTTDSGTPAQNIVRNFTINITDILETVSIDDISVVEGNTGTVNLQFTVTLANTSNQTITVNYATANVDALAGVDYVGVVLGTVTFAPGVTTQPVNIVVNGDFIDEIDETLNVNLTLPVGSNANGITDALGVGTIIDDDNASVIVTPTTITVSEPNLSQTYTIVLTSQPEGETVTIDPNSFNGAWISISPDPVTFDATNWNVPQTVTVTAVNNFLDDDTRTTTIAHSVAGTSGTSPYATGVVTAASVDVTILDDEVAGVIVTPTTITVSEPAGSQTYTVVLTSQPFPGETVTIGTGGFDATWITVTGAPLVFDETNWNVAQTVTVTAVNNFLDDDTRTTTIADSVTGSDPSTRYGDGTVTAASVVVTILDDEVAGVIVTPTTITVSEPAGSQTYTVVLTSQPFPGETVTIGTGGFDATWITVTGAPLVFNETNWNVAQTVTVTAVDNFLDDDTRTTTIADSVTGSDPLTRYGDGTVTAASVVVTILDDEVAGVIVNPTTVTVTEGAPAQTYTVVLTSQPFPGETVTIGTGGFNAAWITVTGAPLVFDETNWNITQTVTVTAVDNFLDDDTRTTTIADSVTGSNPATAYGNGSVTAASVTVTVMDNDNAGVNVTPTTLTVAEPNISQTYSVTLTSQPFPGETVTIGTGGFNTVWITVTGAPLVFNETNWNVAQLVTVTAIDNFLDDNTRATTVANSVTGSNPSTRYGDGTVTAASVVVTINDDDVAGVTVNPTALTVAEPNTSQTYTVRLTSQPFPGETVTIGTGGFDASWITVTGAPLVFNETNWNITQTITVTAIDNLYADGTRTTTIADSVTGSDPTTAYGNGTVTAASVVVTINDNDVAGVIASPTAIGLAEPVSSQTYTVVLMSQPLPGETVTVTPSGFNAAWIAPSAPLTFDGTNWNVPQTFTVSVIDNLIDEGTHSTTISNVTSSNIGTTPYGNGTAIVATVVVTITNDDVAGVVVDTTPLTVAEPNISQTYTVVLLTQPAAGEIVRITPAGFSGDVSTTAFISFTDANWNVPQNITVTAVDNFIADGTRTTTVNNIVSSNIGTTPYGNGTVTTGSVPITILDNDIAGVTINPVNVTVTESSPGQIYTVVLNTQPAAGETVTINMSGYSAEITVAPATVNFTNANWNVAQNITVTAVNNFLDDGTRTTTISHSVSSTNPTTPYGNGTVTALPVDVTINDEDVSGVTVNPTTLIVTELGAAQTFTVVLTAQPFPGETVTITNGGFSTVDITVSPTTITFDNANWNVAQTITVTAVDNFVAEGSRTTTISHTVVGSNPATAYGSAVTAASVTVTVNDNDVAGVTITPTTLTVTELGAAQTYTVVLTSQPAAGETVTITNSGFAAADITVSPTTLTFTAANWTVAQTITVTAVDNFVADGTRTTNIANGVSSNIGATPYGNGSVTAASVAVTINDNDVAGGSVNPTTLTVTELGAVQYYGVVLTSQPAAGETVTITMSGFSAELIVSPTILTFDAANWNVAQYVGVSVTDNFVNDGPRATAIANGVSSNIGTTPYGNGTVTLPSVTVNVVDNDVPGVTISVVNMTIYENDPVHTYTIVLNTEPITGEVVTVDLSGFSADLTVTPITVSFDASNWNVPQTITVTPINNAFADGNRPTVIDHAVTGSDPTTAYGNGTVTAASVPIAIMDDDIPGATFTPRSLQLPEGGDGIYRVRLNTEPLQPVTLTLTFDDTQILVNGLPSPIVLTDIFDNTNYNVQLTFVVSAMLDSFGQGGRTVNITHTFTSLDPAYNFVDLFPVNIGDVTADTQSVPRCVMLSLEESTIARAVIVHPITRGEIYCRIIIENREYAEFMGAGNVGNQAVLDMGVIHAVDIFVEPVPENFTGGLWVCLLGRGDLVYMNQSGMPREPHLLESMFIDGFTCTTIPNAGTLVLVNPIDYSTFTMTPVTCEVVTTAEVNLRAGATTSSAILQVLDYNTTLHVNAVAGGWYRVTVDGVTGWVSANWVREETSCAPPTETP
jgi:hypothetical protein